MEASYVWRDLHQLENEAEQLKRSCEEKRREWESWVNEDKKRKKREEPGIGNSFPKRKRS